MMLTINNGLETKVVGEENVEKVEEKLHSKLKLSRFGNVYAGERKLTSTQSQHVHQIQRATTAATTDEATTTAIVSKESTNAS
uniref:Uncharacterized protein n=1 Tax=Tanacetum cinerariifolium TaxID=118510 RepID=A0A699RTZ4_TANCI|nr:hypothetical protein [Tanacetum cinerariifolium]